MRQTSGLDDGLDERSTRHNLLHGAMNWLSQRTSSSKWLASVPLSFVPDAVLRLHLVRLLASASFACFASASFACFASWPPLQTSESRSTSSSMSTSAARRGHRDAHRRHSTGIEVVRTTENYSLNCVFRKALFIPAKLGRETTSKAYPSPKSCSGGSLSSLSQPASLSSLASLASL